MLRYMAFILCVIAFGPGKTGLIYKIHFITVTPLFTQTRSGHVNGSAANNKLPEVTGST